MGCASGTGISPAAFHDKYSLERRLGSGSYSSVYAVTQDGTAISLAVKVISLHRKPSRKSGGESPDRPSQTLIDRWSAEVEFMERAARHPNVVVFVEALRGPDLAYIVMEQCSHTFLQGLEMLPWLSESIYSGLFCQMLQGLAAVHALDMVHRDVKPDNFLLAKDGRVKLCDFGLAAWVQPGGLRGERGTLPYMAPEMVNREGYNTSVDAWSFGCIASMFLLGKFPYDGPTSKTMRTAISEGTPELDFHPCPSVGASCCITPVATGFTQGLLHREPERRFTVEMALAHEFIVGAKVDPSTTERSLRPTLEAAKALGAFGFPDDYPEAETLDARLAGLQAACRGETAFCHRAQHGDGLEASKKLASASRSSTVAGESFRSSHSSSSTYLTTQLSCYQL